MSSSKIFLGDLPEIINKIIPYLCHDYDYSTLHSCILVNRLWCHLAISLLWEDPFSFPTKNRQFIKIYLCNLNDDDKTKLNENGINYKLLPSNTLFNYPSFIKYLDIWKIFNCIHVKKRASSSKQLIYKALLKTFIESGARLHALILNDSCIVEHFKDFFELILQSPNFIHDIKSLNLDIGNRRNIGNRNNNEILNKIITLLSCNSNLISTLVTHSSAENCSSQIIKSQQNLQKITFFSNYSLNHSLLSLKNSNCSNTLKTIIFSGVSFRNIVILNEVFEKLNVLESVHLLKCFYLDFHFVQQIVNITKPFKLKSLVMTGAEFQVESIELLLQKSGNYLENIGLSLNTSVQSKQQLFELITKYCTKIKFFDLYSSIESYIYLVFDLIKNLGHYLSITINTISEKVGSIVLQKLGQILPFKLEYLRLTLSSDTSSFEVFLKNSQNTFINILIIYIKLVDIDENGDILPYVEKYIMKKKRVKHLALNHAGWNLFYSKDLVKKFKLLYNIKVQDYYDLCIDYSHKKSKIYQDIFN